MSENREMQEQFGQALANFVTNMDRFSEQLNRVVETLQQAAERMAYPQRFALGPGQVDAPDAKDVVHLAGKGSGAPLRCCGGLETPEQRLTLDRARVTCPGRPVEVPEAVVVHLVPLGDSNRLRCCGVPPLERRQDRMTTDDRLVTCPGMPSGS